MNVEDWEASALHEIVATIEREAAARGVAVAGAELVGLMPAGAAAAAAGSILRIDGFDASRLLELRLLGTRDTPGLDSLRGPAHRDRPHRRRSHIADVWAVAVERAPVGSTDAAREKMRVARSSWNVLPTERVSTPTASTRVSAVSSTARSQRS